MDLKKIHHVAIIVSDYEVSRSCLLYTSTDLWTGRDYDCFKKELMRIGAIILGLTVLAVGATAVLGKWVLSVMAVSYTHLLKITAAGQREDPWDPSAGLPE